MSTLIDFSPLYRSTVGFDRIADILENASRIAPANNWPPYDISKLGDDQYRIAMAVAGFSADDLTMIQQPNLLVVAGSKPEEPDAAYLHRGIANRNFERRFELADHVEVMEARLENGLLIVDLKRELPEEMKPRKIPIASKQPSGSQPKTIEAATQAA